MPKMTTITEWRPLDRDELLAQCDPRFLEALTRWRNGPIPDRTMTLGPQWVRWVRRNCRLGEGDLYAQPPSLTPEQQALFWKLGEVTPAGRMRFSTFVYSVGKGSGKTPIGGWLGALSLRGPRVVCAGCGECDRGWLPNGRPHGVRRVSPDVLVMASSFDQADMILDEARVTFDEGPLAEFAKTRKGLIELLQGERGRMRRIPATPKKADGSKATELLVDEVHEFDTELRERAYNVASGGTAKREDGLVCLLSTAGSNLNTLWGRIVARAKRGECDVDELVVVMEADESLDPTDDLAVMEGIRQANPLARRGVADVRKLLKKFREMPLYQAIRYYWNRWVPADAAWLPAGAWDACKGEVVFDPSLPTWIGVDMALKRDSAAIVRVQRRPDGRLQAAAKIWFPDGDLIDQSECDDYLRLLCSTHNVSWIAADEAWWPTLGTLESEGLPIFRMPQQGRNMIIAYGMTYRVIVDRVLVHDGDPLFTDQIASAVPQSSDRGWTLRKGKHNRRIDACPALAGGVFASTLAPREIEAPIPRSAVY